MKSPRVRLVGLLAALCAYPACAGPPFLTDDPEPTETGHWEIYAPLIEGSGKGSDYAGSLGAELNYGAAPDLQLTVGLPAAYAHDAHGFHWGRGDLEVSAKYRFFHDEKVGISIAAFPGITLPTASRHMGSPKITALLPIWAQKDIGRWSIFGGGGYAINPGAGNRDYWTYGAAVTRQMSKNLLAGAEIDRDESDTIGGRGSTRIGLGTIVQFKAPFRLLASGGPAFPDGGGAAEFHFFTAIGLDF